MRNYIILNGISSDTIPGLLISTLPPISKPKIRTTIEEIDGRDGDIVTKLGYSAYDKEFEIGLHDIYDINQVITFFNGEGTIVFSNEDDKYYKYQILDQIDYEKLIRFKKAKVKMHVQPFKYPLEEEPIEIAYKYVNNEAEEMDLDNTKEAPMQIDLKGTGGKNLINLYATQVKRESASYSDINVSNNTLSYSITTTRAGYIGYIIPIDVGQQYTLSYSNLIGNGNAIYSIELDNIITDVEGNYGTPRTSGYSFTATKSYVGIWLNVTTNGGSTGSVSNLMLEKGISASEFEPYGASVSGDNSIEVCGRNLINPNALIHNSRAWSNGVIEDVIRYYRTDYIFVKPNTSYYVTHTFGLGRGYAIWCYDKNKNVLGNINLNNNVSYDESGVVTTLTNTKYVIINFWEDTLANNTPMLVESNEAIDYIPYESASYPISLGVENLFNINRVTANRPNNENVSVSNNIMTITALTSVGEQMGLLIISGFNKSDTYAFSFKAKKVVKGSAGAPLIRAIIYGSDDNNTYTQIASLAEGDPIEGKEYSFSTTITGYKYYRFFLYNNGAAEVTIGEQTQYYDIQLEKGTKTNSYTPYGTIPLKLYTGDNISGTTNNWKIVRADTTEEEITDATLIEQLNALENATSYHEKTHITQNANDKPFILNATAMQKGSGEAVVNNEGNIYSKPTLDIEGNGNIGIYLNGNQIFDVDLSDNEECIIDTTNLEAYDPATNDLLNRKVTGNYSNFILEPGDNEVKATGDITKVTISNYMRWL